MGSVAGFERFGWFFVHLFAKRRALVAFHQVKKRNLMENHCSKTVPALTVRKPISFKWNEIPAYTADVFQRKL